MQQMQGKQWSMTRGSVNVQIVECDEGLSMSIQMVEGDKGFSIIYTNNGA